MYYSVIKGGLRWFIHAENVNYSKAPGRLAKLEYLAVTPVLHPAAMVLKVRQVFSRAKDAAAVSFLKAPKSRAAEKGQGVLPVQVFVPVTRQYRV